MLLGCDAVVSHFDRFGIEIMADRPDGDLSITKILHQIVEVIGPASLARVRTGLIYLEPVFVELESHG